MTGTEPKAITCRESTWLVSDAREESLSPEDAEALARHIETCPLCRGASRQFDVLFRGLRRFLHGPPPEDD